VTGSLTGGGVARWRPWRACLRLAARLRRPFREEWSASRPNGAAFATAYAQNLSHRLPLIYCVVVVNAWLLVWTFRKLAPPVLALFVPLGLMAVVAVRAWHWRPAAVRARRQEVLVNDLVRLPGRCLAVSGGFAAWALSLYGYGNEAEQDLVHYITAITCFAGILSLGQSPRTALTMAATVMLPASLVFLGHDNPNRFVVVSVQIVVTALLLLITAAYHRDFVRLESSRIELRRNKLRMEKLTETYRQRAIRDPLTGAWNRSRILSLIEAGLDEPITERPWLALVDLDGFKHINDTFGHLAGDAVLTAVSQRICRAPDVAACGRMGGDEFAVLLRGGLDERRVQKVLGLLAGTIAKPVQLGEMSLTLHASIGYYRCVGVSVSACLERADTALYKAKELRKGGVAAFDAADERSLLERQVMTRVFTSADLRKQLAVVFQPIVDADTLRPLSFETLVRWSPDGRRLLSPAAFINLAENTGRISEVTHVVLEKALSEFPAWQWGCSLSVNLSAHDILREDAAEWISGLVRKAGAPPASIVFEITETALLRDYGRAAANLAKLRTEGFRISLDDFGTGQSSLAHVHNLPLDQIKIDQSFAETMSSSDSARAIIGTVLALSRQLGLECTIEGIETIEQQLAARALGLRQMQGYLFGRPAGAVEARRLVAAPEGSLADPDQQKTRGAAAAAMRA
jgi:diguanylate cyclase (GGDEF)-like protein